MYFHLHRSSKKWTFYSANILKCETFLIALMELRTNPKKWTFLLCKIRMLIVMGRSNLSVKWGL